MAKIIFNDTTDYNEVYLDTIKMFGDISATKDCCGEAKRCLALCKANQYLKAAQLAQDASNTNNFEDAVKVSYLTLYPFTKIEYN